MAAEAVKQLEKAKSDKPRVLELQTQEGGVQLPGYFVTQSHLKPGAEWAKKIGLRMELDRGLGGVVARYTYREQAFVALIPMTHIRCLELAE